MELKIGDRVKVKEYAQIPEDLRTKAIAAMSGDVGTVVDKLYSEYNEGYVYRVKFDVCDKISSKMWTEDFLDKFEEHPTEYKYEFVVEDSVVVAFLYEIVGDKKTLIARGHGHIMHNGALGIAQASSYALKRIYMDLNGGSF